MAIIILKSQIKGELMKAEMRGYERAERETKRKLDDALHEQRGLYELKIQSLEADISMLENLVSERDKKIKENKDKELQARQIFLKAKEIIGKVDYYYREHANNTALSSVKFKKIRDEAEGFARTLIPEETI